jgi:hypothetical protein
VRDILKEFRDAHTAVGVAVAGAGQASRRWLLTISE